ncbi:MAG: hypothetical protein ABH843_03160 [Candidatus Omnitrophota bacterium]
MRLSLRGIYLNILKRPKVLLIASVSTTILFLAAYAFLFGDYAAKAKILITDTASGGGGAAEDKVSAKALRTTAEVLKSRFLMEEVVEQLNLEDTFGKGNAVNKLLSIVKTKPVRGTDIIEISVRLRRPELATHIANAICKVIITDSVKNKFSFEKDMLSWLTEQSSSIRKELESAAERLREFKRSAGVIDLAAEHDAMWMRIEGLRNNLAIARTKRQDSDMAYNEIKGYVESGSSLEEIPYVQNDSEYKKMKLQQEALDKEKQDFLGLYQPSHPSVVEIDEKLSKLRLSIPARAKEIIEGVKQGYEVPKAKEEELQALIKKESDELLSLEEKLDKYNAFADDIKEKETAYNAFLKRIEDGFGSGVLMIRQVELLEQAYLPRKKEGPSVFLVIVTGLLVGFILGGIYNIIKDEKISFHKKETSSAHKDKGMYIERVKEEEQEK